MECGEDMVSPMSGEHQEAAVTVDVYPAAEEEQHHTPLAAVAREEEASTSRRQKQRHREKHLPCSAPQPLSWFNRKQPGAS